MGFAFQWVGHAWLVSARPNAATTNGQTGGIIINRKAFLKSAAALLCFVSTGQALAQESLTVWWVKGYYKAEDDALLDVIKKFEAKTSVKVQLSQYPEQDMIPKTVAALDAGAPPDVA